jgi:DNA transformation protein
MKPPYLKDCVNLFAPLGKITSHSMFGGFGLFSDNVIFAFVVESDLHIRADKVSSKEFEKQGFKPYQYVKRGFLVTTKYYALPKALLADTNCVLKLAEDALRSAKNEKRQKLTNPVLRIKDLPNLTLSIERMLKNVGIKTVEELRKAGAIKAFHSIRVKYNNVNNDFLFVLEGAIEGHHWSVIPQKRKDELLSQLDFVNQKL